MRIALFAIEPELISINPKSRINKSNQIEYTMHLLNRNEAELLYI